MGGKFNRFLWTGWGIAVAGILIGVTAVLLQRAGNPPNMGLCVACFERDVAGALGFHRASPVQYPRPEIAALLLGSFLGALLFGEFKPRGGSAPLARFALGCFAMLGALVFLGCPYRACLRLAGGDGNALVGFAGLACGIAGGVQLFKRGYNPGRSAGTYRAVGLLLPVCAAGLLLCAFLRPKISPHGAVFFSTAGPGARHAPVLLSLGAGLLIGFFAQRTRFCTVGAFRDVILMGDTHLLKGVAGLIVAAFVANLALGEFHPGFTLQPIAHSDVLWNFLGLALAGLAFTLAGGCPGRQLILAGEGDGDAGVFVLGMIAGAGFAHNFGLAASPEKLVEGAVVGGVPPPGQVAVLAGLVVCAVLGVTMRDRL